MSKDFFQTTEKYFFTSLVFLLFSFNQQGFCMEDEKEEKLKTSSSSAVRREPSSANGESCGRAQAVRITARRDKNKILREIKRIVRLFTYAPPPVRELYLPKPPIP